jgi:hypothetical protein
VALEIDADDAAARGQRGDVRAEHLHRTEAAVEEDDGAGPPAPNSCHASSTPLTEARPVARDAAAVEAAAEAVMGGSFVVWWGAPIVRDRTSSEGTSIPPRSSDSGLRHRRLFEGAVARLAFLPIVSLAIATAAVVGRPLARLSSRRSGGCCSCQVSSLAINCPIGQAATPANDRLSPNLTGDALGAGGEWLPGATSVRKPAAWPAIVFAERALGGAGGAESRPEAGVEGRGLEAGAAEPRHCRGSAGRSPSTPRAAAIRR